MFKVNFKNLISENNKFSYFLIFLLVQSFAFSDAYVSCGGGYDSYELGNCELFDDECADEIEFHEVRCCSDVYIPFYTQQNGCEVWAESQFTSIGEGGNGCVSEVTFAEAEAVCAGEGARLCTLEELQAGCTAGTGCAHDSDMIWTSQQCGNSGELTCEDQGMWDNNEWITWWFGYDCEASVANWSCGMGITHPDYDHIYDVCPVTCGICDDCLSDIYDCNGNCDGDAVIDECDVCDGFGAVYECGCSDALENYDCDGNCVVEIDCTGTCGGDAVVDECGVCDGDGIVDGTCDCDGNTLDGCGVCGGNADGSDCNNDGVDDVCEETYDTGFYDGAQSGDINQDGMTNVVDIILYVNVVLGN